MLDSVCEFGFCVCVCVGSPSDAGWRHLSLSGITSGGLNKPSSGLEETEEERKKKIPLSFLSFLFPGHASLSVCVCVFVYEKGKERNQNHPTPKLH